MKQPSPETQRLAEGVGTWAGEERMPPSDWAPDGVVAEGRSTARMALGGYALVSEYTQSVGGRVTMQGIAITLWNREEGRYEMHWFGNREAAPWLMTGAYDGDALVLQGPGPEGGLIRHRSDHPDADSSRTVSEVSMDGGATWTHAFEGVYRRQDPG